MMMVVIMIIVTNYDGVCRLKKSLRKLFGTTNIRNKSEEEIKLKRVYGVCVCVCVCGGGDEVEGWRVKRDLVWLRWKGRERRGGLGELAAEVERAEGRTIVKKKNCGFYIELRKRKLLLLLLQLILIL